MGVAVADDLESCRACGGRGYFHCECWPADCLCGGDYEPCDECDGTGWIDPWFSYEEDEYWREMEARVALKASRTHASAAPSSPKPDAKKAAHRAKVKARRKQKHGGKR